MLGELVKILADEPEKIEIALIKGIRIGLSIIIAAFIYTSMIGNFKLIPLNAYDQLVNFFLSGRVLICLFLFFLSDYIIIPILEFAASLPFLLLRRLKAGKLTDVDVTALLSFFGIINIRGRNSIPLPGKNIDILKSFVFSLNEEQTKDEAIDLKDTIIRNVWNLYCTFIVIYFVVIDSAFHTHFLTTVILCGFLIVFLMTYGIQLIFDYLLEKHTDIFKALSYIKTYDFILRFLRQYYIVPIRASKESGLRKAQVFTHGNKEYVLFIPDRRFNQDEIERLLTKRGLPDRIFIIIAPEDMLDVTDELFLKFHDNLILISYSDEKHLGEQLRLTFDTISKSF